MDIIAQLVVSGISVGMIYSVVAFGYQLTFATSNTLNFGQGEALMLGSLVGFSVVTRLIAADFGPGIAYAIMLPIVLIVGATQGILVEWIAVRRGARSRSSVTWILATIALGIILRNIAENVWGRDPMKFPSPVSEQPLIFGSVRVQPMEILIVIGALALMLAVELFNRRSIYGKAFVATSIDRSAAELVGISTTRVISMSYALSSLSAAFAGVLIAPVTLTGAGIGLALGLKGFAVGIIGGLSSGLGVIAGGLILGIAETLTGYYISSGYKDVPGLVMLLLVLSFRPSGLFGKASIRKV